MAVQTIETLKEKFKSGSFPTQQDYHDVFDSFLSKGESLTTDDIKGTGDSSELSLTQILASLDIPTVPEGLDEFIEKVNSFLEDTDVADETINKWKEIESFLTGITDTETLTGLLASLKTEILGEIPAYTAGEGVDISEQGVISLKKEEIYFTNESSTKSVVKDGITYTLKKPDLELSSVDERITIDNCMEYVVDDYSSVIYGGEIDVPVINTKDGYALIDYQIGENFFRAGYVGKTIEQNDVFPIDGYVTLKMKLAFYDDEVYLCYPQTTQMSGVTTLLLISEGYLMEYSGTKWRNPKQFIKFDAKMCKPYGTYTFDKILKYTTPKVDLTYNLWVKETKKEYTAGDGIEISEEGVISAVKEVSTKKFCEIIDDLDASDAPAGTIAMYGGQTNDKYTHGFIYEKSGEGGGMSYVYNHTEYTNKPDQLTQTITLSQPAEMVNAKLGWQYNGSNDIKLWKGVKKNLLGNFEEEVWVAVDMSNNPIPSDSNPNIDAILYSYEADESPSLDDFTYSSMETTGGSSSPSWTPLNVQNVIN